MRIETSRLYIEEVKKEDALAVLNIQNTEYARKFNLFPKLTIEDVNQEIDKDEMYKLILKENGMIIGVIRANEDYYRNNPKARHIVILMREEFSSHGYMSEGVCALFPYLFTKYEILTGYIFKENVASIRVSEKCGWNVEGTLRQAVTDINGDVHDLVIVSLTKADFEAQH